MLLNTYHNAFMSTATIKRMVKTSMRQPVPVLVTRQQSESGIMRERIIIIIATVVRKEKFVVTIHRLADCCITILTYCIILLLLLIGCVGQDYTGWMCSSAVSDCR